MSLAKLVAKKLAESEVDTLVDGAVQALKTLPGLRQIILFGSAAAWQMTEASDLDFVLIFSSKSETNNARKEVFQISHKMIAWPCDFICVDEETFQERSVMGGVLFVAHDEGRIVYRGKGAP